MYSLMPLPPLPTVPTVPTVMADTGLRTGGS